MIKFNRYRYKPFSFNRESTYETRLISSIQEMYEFGDDYLIGQVITDLRETIKKGVKHTEELDYKYLSEEEVVLALDNETDEITIFYDIGPGDEFSMVGFMDQESLDNSCI